MENSLVDLWGAIQKAGPFAGMIMFYLWWKTDGERLKLQSERDALLERVLDSMNTASSSIVTITEVFKSNQKKGGS